MVEKTHLLKCKRFINEIIGKYRLLYLPTDDSCFITLVKYAPMMFQLQ